MNPKLLLCLLTLWAPVGNALRRTEFRIPLPFTLEQCRIGHLYAINKASIFETGGGEGVVVARNEPLKKRGAYGAGQFTHKVYHLASKMPAEIRMMAPNGALEVWEKSWNVFPYVRTRTDNPGYLRDLFKMTTESWYIENDDCQRDDVFGGKREVVLIDIVNDLINSKDYKAEEDPAKCRSEKLNLGPLTSDWKTKKPRLCVYKLVEAELVFWGMQDYVERNLMQLWAPRLFRNLHRQMFCWADEWADLSMVEMRELEEETKERLDELLSVGDVRGTSEE